ncbi:MAG: ParB N-terminal domain-containing protein [Candidatus Yanofskybacteria bacterium]|nr:ParB N-terminal domain-containing protein [Candidatus Yanofskybacteria bacterium]
MSNTESMPVIESTTDYTLFKTLKGNRIHNKSHIRKLRTLIKDDPKGLQYTPIVVNNRYEIIDGQHRIEAVKQINDEFGVQIPVYYLINPKATIKTAQMLNSSSKSWSPNDYALSYSTLGNENYEIYLDFKKRYKLNHDVLLSYLGMNNPISSVDFKDGKFAVEDEDKSANLCDKLLTVGKFYPEYKKRSFALAFKILWQDERFNWEKALAFFEKEGDKIQHQPRPDMYKPILAKVLE